MASAHAAQAIASGDLTDLVSSSSSATVYPSDDTLLAVLQARFRSDLPYTRVGASNLIVVNPYKTLANVNDISAKEYEERCYKDTSFPLPGTQSLPPHLYDLAARIYLLMRRRTESQAVVFRQVPGITASGKSASSQLLVNQLLRLSTHSKKEAKLSEQLKSLSTLLDSFGNAKTLVSPNASRHSRYLELHFNDRGRIQGAKVLTYGLDKSRLSRLTYEERTYHIFYQFLAGATPDERDRYGLEDVSDYALLSSSGCYRLPSGPFSDDSIAMEDLRVAMKLLGFKAKHFSSIFSLIVAILLLGNLQFGEADARDVSAYISNPLVLDQVARLLGVPSEELSEVLTNKTSYVRKELYTVMMNATQSGAQRDQLAKDLYAILFAFVTETANHKFAPSSQDPPPATQVVLFDEPGFQTKGITQSASMYFGGPTPLIGTQNQSGFEEFCINFSNELVHSYILRNTFEDSVGHNSQLTGDGVALPAISIMDNSGCVELLRGAQLNERAHRKPGGLLGVLNKSCSSHKSGKSGDKKEEEMLQELVSRFGVHTSFIAPGSPEAPDQMTFGVNHYAGSCTYDIRGFIEKDTDILDCAFVTLLRGSTDPFIAKLMAGPSLATERHSKDESIIVQAQVSSRPLRAPTVIASRDGSRVPPGEEHARLDPSKVYPISTQINYTLSEIMWNLDRAHLWTVSCIRPNDSGMANSFDKRRVKAQIRALLLPDLVARKKHDLIVDFEQSTFCDRYVPTIRGSDSERIRQCASSNGWKEGEDYVIGHRMIWLTYAAWKVVEDVLRASEKDTKRGGTVADDESVAADDATEYTHQESLGAPGPFYGGESEDNLLLNRGGPQSAQSHNPSFPTPSYPETPGYSEPGGGAWGYDYKERAPDTPNPSKEGGIIAKAPDTVEEVPTSKTRRYWLFVVRLTTWWIPAFMLAKIGRMKRPDIQLAWREKITIFWLIFIFNGIVIFYIVAFGKLLCPDFDKAWSLNEVAQHTTDNNWWVTVQGEVYDLSNFIHGQHSDVANLKSNTDDVLDELVGQDLTGYFPIPLYLGCSDLVTDTTLSLTPANFTPLVSQAMHKSGPQATLNSAKLKTNDWYTATFLPKMQNYQKGPLVYTKSAIKSAAGDTDNQRFWATYNDNIYDLSDYINSQSLDSGSFSFINSDLVDLFQQQPGQDITKSMNSILGRLSDGQAQFDCVSHMFFVGKVDFRQSARCTAQNIILLVISIILMVSIGIKFLAALQLSPKRNPEMLDKFVLCQVPCYTEGEESLRRTVDSLAALNYDDKRKLIFIICDGNIIGTGNDRTTPRIVLDILGVDPKLDPEPLLYKAIGEGSKQLNYGKVYSGLYEFEGHVVPYIVVVKVGKPTERTKPGNRGKRDSQILIMQYLNRVHFDSPMAPLELEIYHQMRNVIGIDPAFYEYIFTVDADTTVTPESVNRLVASAADDSSIIGICGETKLDNEEGSWWTMIQVYEYYISHNLSKAFESLFGSVTCLPGCFSMYRIRTADKGRPIIISNRVIEEYAEPIVDTLHKKNLFSLGEDRYLTTLLLKHFPTFRTKFTPDAVAHTIAPESWRVLFSQRRRWINSTVHNLCELVFLPELFGFCCFSMRFFVFIDLLGTLILPATVVYLFYLIIVVALGQAPLPTLSLIMLAAVYGLQAVIFLLKREFMLIGWMVVYLLSYPVYSFFLPIYAFWCMDDFSWGNTRLVIGEGSNKKVIMNDEEKYDDSMIPLKKFSEYEAEAWETGSRHSDETGYHSKSPSRPPQGSRTHSPRPSYAPSQPGATGDYYRDTNMTNPAASMSHGNHSQSNLSHYGAPQSAFGAPQLPFMGFNNGSVHGSDYGGAMPMAGPMTMYGMMPPNAPRNTMMPMFTGGGSVHGSQGGFAPPMAPGLMGMQQRPMSTFSLATTVNPFSSGPSQSTDPTDEELIIALRAYLSTQDLMTVTKKTARDAMQTRFPKADLSSKKQFLNESIDNILSQS
ncbi:chitin synthase [Epithele typhae]|uniref:chitin synthase n=1 Tax=Epithele typhae TaxID=378194 RepID=UPI002007C291|nr:chitin synthase [Epithele typhae]KAH9939246.1 chitin synthase [Epithele typhae]